MKQKAVSKRRVKGPQKKRSELNCYLKGDYDMPYGQIAMLLIKERELRELFETQPKRQIVYGQGEEMWYIGSTPVSELPEWSPQELERRGSPSPPSSFVPDVSTSEGRLCATRQNLLNLLRYIATRDMKHSELSM